MKKLLLLIALLMPISTFALELINNFEWLEPKNTVEVVVGESYQLKFNCSDNTLPFTSDYADYWNHYDFDGGQHMVSTPTGYSINEKGVITGLVPGTYAIKFTGYILPKSGINKMLMITVVSERSETESNNTLDTANDIYTKIRFGLFNTSDVDYFKFTNGNLKWGDAVTFKIHYYGSRENPFGYKWATFCGTNMAAGGSLNSQDQECRALVSSGNTVYLEVYYDQSLSQYFNYGEEFVAEVYINGEPVSGVTPITIYKLTYIVDEEEYKNYEVEYGTTITPEEDPTKEGYTFSGWSEIPATMPAQDLTITGSFTANKYKLTYIIDGEEYKTIDVAYGVSITAEAEPTKEGYSFSGWSEIPATMPAHDVNVSGTFTVQNQDDVDITKVEIDGIYYNLITKGKVAEVTSNPNNPNYYSGNVIIPDKITFEETEYLVTNIGLAAFEWSSGLTSITIPNSVTTIGNEAFWGCRSLTTIIIPNSVTSIGQYAFCECYDLTSIELPNSITSVTEGVFQNCTSLTSIIIPGSATSIGYKSFAGCSNLESITIPNSVTSIGKYAFLSCTGLTSITFPNSLTTIEEWAFWGCTGLTSVTFSNSVTTISNFAFYECSRLTSITFGSGIRFIGLNAFASCPELIDLYCYANNVPSTNSNAFSDSYIEYTTLHVPQSSIDSYSTTEPWKNFKEIVKINLPKHTLSYILDGEIYKIYEIEEGETIKSEPAPTKEGYTFSGWSEIPETMPACDVVLSGYFTEIIETGFCGENLTWKYGVVSRTLTISGTGPMDYFSDSSAMPWKGYIDQVEKVIIEDGVTSIGDNAFYGCSGMTSVHIPNSVTFIGGYAFGGCSSLPNVTIPSSVIDIGSGAFSGCSGLTSVTIGNSVECIGIAAFANCISLTSVVIPENVTSIEEHAFGGCTSLTTVIIPNSVTYIGFMAFSRCKSLSSVIVPDGITNINFETFGNCSGLTSITIPNSVTSIEDKAFAECNNIKDVYCFAEEVPSTGINCFNKSNIKDATLHVSGTSKEKYRNDAVWGAFGTIVAPSYTLTFIVDGEEYNSFVIEEGTDITIEYHPQKKGYTFILLDEMPETMPSHDVTVTGSFTINKYTLAYVVDGENYVTYEMNYGTQIFPLPELTKEGYTFSGWSEIPETMLAKDVTITGSFNVNSYKLTYMVDGEEYKTINVEYGATITAEAAPTKEGYTFSGWNEVPATMPANDVTITGSFGINSYKLTYTVDGEEYKSVQVKYGEEITAEAEPTKEGCTFSGWNDIPATMPAKDIMVTGSFIVNSYKLTYMVDGEEYKIVDVAYGASIIAEAAPTKEGHSFSGWVEMPATMPSHDVTVTGSFTINKYTLAYIIDGETYTSYEVNYGTQIFLLPELTKKGYTFSGWSEIPETMPAKDVTVTGSFNVNRYKLTYMVDGEEYKTIDVEYGATITAEAAPTKEGYTFSGWNEVPATMPANDVTITGSFGINSYKLTYTVDGEEYKSVQVKYGEEITAEAEPMKEGCTFSGWNDIPATMPAKDITVTGSFIVNSYKLTYMVDGEEYKIVDVAYGASIIAEAAPTKEGYSFSGWVEMPATMPSHDVTVTGSFTINKYTLAYVVDGENYVTYEVNYGTQIFPLPELTKDGYTFSGWSTIPETMPAHDVTITGTFTFIDAIEGVTAADDEYQIYTIDGKPVETLQKGVNIIRFSNGTTKKVGVK